MNSQMLRGRLRALSYGHTKVTSGKLKKKLIIIPQKATPPVHNSLRSLTNWWINEKSLFVWILLYALSYLKSHRGACLLTYASSSTTSARTPAPSVVLNQNERFHPILQVHIHFCSPSIRSPPCEPLSSRLSVLSSALVEGGQGMMMTLLTWEMGECKDKRTIWWRTCNPPSSFHTQAPYPGRKGAGLVLGCSHLCHFPPWISCF